MKDVLEEVKFQGIQKSEFKDARKRLEIESKSFEDGYHWRWTKEDNPEKLWRDLSKEVF
ncbi:hypothetical protein [Lachnotalea glycerini]|uniref:hypothetical protein n=1 Tax=Lachnotalea glycerini TaxID=1763509 RepID=UPI0014731F7B|nr:hypothetical protein [Lachnotalea glycerini]